jgi:hypothetical protein
MIQTLFTILISLQFLVVALHDWVNIPGWSHGRQVQLALGRNKMLIGTLINCVFPGLAVAFAFYYWHRPKPGFVLDYWVIYCAVTVISAITAWWIPYFRGTDEKTKKLYAECTPVRETFCLHAATIPGPTYCIFIFTRYF